MVGENTWVLHIEHIFELILQTYGSSGIRILSARYRARVC